MTWLGAKVSRSEVSSFPKNTFSVGIFSRNRPHTPFLGLIGYMVHSGAKLFRTKTLLNFASKALSNLISKKHVFSLNFCTKSHLTYLLGQTDKMARLVAKVSRSAVSSILKNTFSVGIFWLNRPHTSFRGLIRYMVCSGAKLFRTKTLLNFASKALSNSFFPKNTFSIWIFVLNRTSPIFLAKRTRWHDWGQNCPGVKLRASWKTRFWLEFFDETGSIPLFGA